VERKASEGSFLERLERQAKQQQQQEPQPVRTLAEEREAMKTRERKKRETAEAVQQMRDRLRAMGLLKKGQGVEGGEGGEEDVSVGGAPAREDLRAEEKRDGEGGLAAKGVVGEAGGLSDEDFMDAAPTHKAEQGLKSTGGLSGMLRTMFGKKDAAQQAKQPDERVDPPPPPPPPPPPQPAALQVEVSPAKTDDVVPLTPRPIQAYQEAIRCVVSGCSRHARMA
jgi:hypothetical protein